MLKKISSGIVVLAAIVGGGIALLNYFVLPGCDSSRVTDTIHSIFSGQNLQLTALNDFKTVSDESSRKNCQAHIETAEEIGTIDYSVTWDGWDTQVRIENVAAVPRDGAAPAPPPG